MSNIVKYDVAGASKDRQDVAGIFHNTFFTVDVRRNHTGKTLACHFFKATVPSLKGKVDGNQQKLLFHVRIKNDECIMSTRRYVVNSELPFKAKKQNL